MQDLAGERVEGSVIRLDAADNVVVARHVLAAGTALESYGVVPRDRVPAGYGVAVVDLAKGEPVLDGAASLEEMGEGIFARFLEVASGAATKSELLDLGRHELIPSNIGIVG